MKIGDLIRYDVISSQWYNMLGIITEISKAPSGGSMTHALVTFQNGEQHWAGELDFEVINENR